MSKLNLIFMGTPDFALSALQTLYDHHNVVAVYTQPPRPAGRGQKEQKSPVHLFAEQHHIPVYTPTSLRTQEAQKEFSALNADLAVVAAYGLILPKAILEIPKYGCINIHASLLPRWRGAAPLHHAILAGDSETGITIMQMDEGMDTGDMLLQDKIAMTPDMTTGQLHDKLAAMGSQLILKTLNQLGTLTPRKQPEDGVTYADKITKDMGHIDWHKPVAILDRQIRAMTPFPGAYFEKAGKRYKVLSCEVLPLSGSPGALLDDHLTVGCGTGSLRITSLQKEGGRPLSASEFLRGVDWQVGEVLL